MAAGKLKKKAKNASKTTEPEPERNYLDLFQEHKQKIIIAVSIIMIITIACLSYLYWTSKTEDNAWVTFSDFINDSQVPDKINETRVQEVLGVIKDTTAEPWFLFYCSSFYLEQQEYDKAADMVKRLEDRFPSHLLVKETRLVSRLKESIKDEKSWAEKVTSKLDSGEINQEKENQSPNKKDDAPSEETIKKE